ncbi:MAG: hypothetical protein EBU85_06550, partial [Actinobacteria bacterium]|nr:hypothetical protein [Actinomycetota bacterium]
ADIDAINAALETKTNVDDFTALSDDVSALTDTVDTKANQTSLDELSAQVAFLGSEVSDSALQSDLDALADDVRAEWDMNSADIDAINASLDTKADAESVDSSLTDLAGALGEQAAVLVDFDGNITDLQNQITDLDSGLAQAQADFDAFSSQADAQFSGIATELGDVKSTFSNYYTVADIDTALNGVYDSLAVVDETLSTKVNSGDLTALLGDVQGQFDQLGQTMDANSASVSGLIDDLSSRLTDVTSSADVTADALVSLTGRFDALPDFTQFVKSSDLSAFATADNLNALTFQVMLLDVGVNSTIQQVGAEVIALAASLPDFTTFAKSSDLTNLVSMSTLTTALGEYAKASDLANSTSDIQNQVNSVKTSVTALQSDVETLQQSVSTLSNSVSSLQTEKADKTEVAQLRAALCDAANFAHSKDSDYPVPSFCPAS